MPLYTFNFRQDESSDGIQRRDDIYLVKKEPGRGNKIVEHSKQANLHLIAEFGLQVGMVPSKSFLAFSAFRKYIHIHICKVRLGCCKVSCWRCARGLSTRGLK